MLRHGLLVLMLAGLIYTVTPAAMAQDSGNNDQQGAQAGPGGMDMPGLIPASVRR